MNPLTGLNQPTTGLNESKPSSGFNEASPSSGLNEAMPEEQQELAPIWNNLLDILIDKYASKEGPTNG